MISAKLTSRGRITLPKSVRDGLGLRPGDRVEFVLGKGREAVMRLVDTTVDEVFGLLNRDGIRPLSVENMDVGIRDRWKR